LDLQVLVAQLQIHEQLVVTLVQQARVQQVQVLLHLVQVEQQVLVQLVLVQLVLVQLVQEKPIVVAL
jgi:hypothetical protein